jgi:hypothetical protein
MRYRRGLAAVISEVAAEVDRHIEAALASAEELLRRKGASDDECRSFMSDYQIQLAEWRVKALAEFRGWLSRDGEALH